MASTAREDLLAAGLAVFDRDGFEGATVAAIRTRARASNGSFFHFFGSKKELAGTLFLEVLQRYHAAILAAVQVSCSDSCTDSSRDSCGARQGVARLIRAHLDWVVNHRRDARYLFEISRSEWTEDIRGAQRAQNSRLADGIERWRAPLIARGELLPMTPTLFFSQIIGPAQIFCRAYLAGRDRADPRDQTETLIACAIRAVVAPDAAGENGDIA
jgi:AcrR family transcriptional regulator